MIKLNPLTTALLASLALTSAAEAAPFGLQTQAGAHVGAHATESAHGLGGSANSSISASGSVSATHDTDGDADTTATATKHEGDKTGAELETRSQAVTNAARQRGNASVKAGIAAQGQAEGDAHRASLTTQAGVSAAASGSADAAGKGVAQGEAASHRASATAAGLETRSHSAAKAAPHGGKASAAGGANVNASVEVSGSQQ